MPDYTKHQQNRLPIHGRDEFTIVSDEDLEFASGLTLYHLSGYAVFRYPGERSTTRLHRVIMNAPDGIEVDHINGDRLDNRRENLRLCTHDENMKNRLRDKRNTSGYYGVSPTKGRWRADIHFNGKQHYLGTFRDPRHAAMIRDMAVLDHYGEFCNLNLNVIGYKAGDQQ